jgi:hypothetical protein
LAKKRTRHTRILIIPLLPLIIILWIIGWSLFWTGSPQDNQKTTQTPDKNDGIEITVNLPEEYPQQQTDP